MPPFVDRKDGAARKCPPVISSPCVRRCIFGSVRTGSARKVLMPSFKNILPGDLAPWFQARATTREKFAFDTAGGRYLVLCFFATADQRGKAAVDVAFAQPELFDPTLRVLKVIPLRPDGSDGNELVTYMKSLPPSSTFAGFEVQAPILVLTNVFEPEFCEKLIALYEAHGNDESGFMREVDGRTVQIHDHGHKRRRDHIITDNEIMRHAQKRFHRAVVPELLKSYQYKATRM